MKAGAPTDSTHILTPSPQLRMAINAHCTSYGVDQREAIRNLIETALLEGYCAGLDRSQEIVSALVGDDPDGPEAA